MLIEKRANYNVVAKVKNTGFSLAKNLVPL